jgi:hypothetical protein
VIFLQTIKTLMAKIKVRILLPSCAYVLTNN